MLLGQTESDCEGEQKQGFGAQRPFYIGYSETCMNWNDAAEDLLNQILRETPHPVRDATETQLRATAEGLAADESKNRVGVETVIDAWVRTTPEALRSDLPRRMERFGLDPEEYRHLLEA
jgi:hypothetical protein